jgi:hypothetical protein
VLWSWKAQRNVWSRGRFLFRKDLNLLARRLSLRARHSFYEDVMVRQLCANFKELTQQRRESETLNCFRSFFPVSSEAEVDKERGKDAS